MSLSMIAFSTASQHNRYKWYVHCAVS